MKTSIYTPHSFHSDIIRRAVWMYFRSNFSFRDIEELIIERGVDVSYETIRRWIDKFGSTCAERISNLKYSPVRGFKSIFHTALYPLIAALTIKEYYSKI